MECTFKPCKRFEKAKKFKSVFLKDYEIGYSIEVYSCYNDYV